MRTIMLGLPFGVTTVSSGDVPHLHVLPDRWRFSPVRSDGSAAGERGPSVLVGADR